MTAQRRPRISVNVMSAIRATGWAIKEEKLWAIMDMLEMRAQGAPISEVEYKALSRQAPSMVTKPGQGIAVMELYGVLSQRMNMLSEFSGGTSTGLFGMAFDKLVADESVRAIVIDVDSPGGGVAGTAELAQKVADARGKKPIFAIANSLSASAAYWIMSAASELWATPTADVGSIGVFAVHEDISRAADQEGITYTLIKAGKYKTEGNPFEPLGDVARQAMQDRVDELYAMFTSAVARYRGVSLDTVRNGFGQGRAIGSSMALREGMIDRIGTLDQLVKRASTALGTASLARANYTVASAFDDADGMLAAMATEAAALRLGRPTSTSREAQLALLERELAINAGL